MDKKDIEQFENNMLEYINNETKNSRSITVNKFLKKQINAGLVVFITDINKICLKTQCVYCNKETHTNKKLNKPIDMGIKKHLKLRECVVNGIYTYIVLEFNNLKIFKQLNLDTNEIFNLPIKCKRCNKIYKVFDTPMLFPNSIATDDGDSDFELKQ